MDAVFALPVEGRLERPVFNLALAVVTVEVAQRAQQHLEARVDLVRVMIAEVQERV